LLFNKFIIVLNQRASTEDSNSFWWYTTYGHFRAIGRRYHKDVIPLLTLIENNLSSLGVGEISPKLTTLLQQLKLLPSQ